MSRQTIMLTGEEDIVLMDDFLNPGGRLGEGSGRTTRRALQYVLLGMKAGGIHIECEDHEDGDLIELQKKIETICQALNLFFVAPISFDGIVHTMTLRIHPHGEAVEAQTAFLAEQAKAKSAWDDAVHAASMKQLERELKDLRSLRNPTVKFIEELQERFDPPPPHHGRITRWFHRITGQ